MMGMPGKRSKRDLSAAPIGKRILRSVLIAAGTALVVTIVDALLFPEPADGHREED